MMSKEPRHLLSMATDDMSGNLIGPLGRPNKKGITFHPKTNHIWEVLMESNSTAACSPSIVIRADFRGTSWLRSCWTMISHLHVQSSGQSEIWSATQGVGPFVSHGSGFGIRIRSFAQILISAILRERWFNAR